MKRYKGIPIKAAQAIAKAFDKDQVIIVTWDKAYGKVHVTTYGKTIDECVQAAEGGNRIKRALGWAGRLRRLGRRRRPAGGFMKPRCTAITKAGARCPLPAVPSVPAQLCGMHFGDRKG